ncbi:MAG: hypothetical protein IPG45_14155 [Deltaproteobacteria bacterium]|nr:hypothetical protein [Deltaproteobacteria bacterium]
MKRALPWALALASLACTRQPATPVEVPPEVRYASVIAVDGAGAFLRASPLVPWGEGQSLPVFGAEDQNLVVVGWSLEQLGEVGVAGAVVEAASDACEPRLPVPLWAGRVGKDGITPAEIAALPRLKAAGVVRCNASLQPVIGIEGCSACTPRVVNDGPCRTRFDYSICGLGEVVVLSQNEDQACVLPPERAGDWQCRLRPASGTAAVAEASCTTPIGDCGATFYRFPTTPPFQQETFPFRDVPTFTPDLVVRHARYSPRNLASGWAWSMQLLNGEIQISTTGTTAIDFCFQRQPGPGELVHLALDTGQFLYASPTPSCLSQIRVDARGPGVVGTYLDETGHFRLGRFSPTGALEHSEPITPTDGADLSWRTAQQIGMEVAGPFYFIYFGGIRTDDRVHVHAQNSIMSQNDRALPGLDATVSRRANAQTAVLGTGGAARLVWLELSDLSISHETLVPTEPVNDHSDGVYTLDIQEDRIYVGASPPAALYVFDRGGEFRSRHPTLGVPGIPVRLIVWPKEGRRLLVLSTRPGLDPKTYETWASFFDRDAERFLPGEWRIGEGVVTDAQFDGEGRLYLLLPWAAEVVRLTGNPVP